MTHILKLVFIIFLCLPVLGQPTWSQSKTNNWYKNQSLLIGSNYLPKTAINQLEMFQSNTFDLKTIDNELALAQSIGLNTMRVYLHDLLWLEQKNVFLKNLNIFLDLCEKHKIKPVLVLFDSCWDPFPKLGKQHSPVDYLHNSGWVQSPGADIIKDETQWPKLEKYVKGLITTYKNDSRILAWDVWNEPDNTNNSSYGKMEPLNKVKQIEKLLPMVFKWAKSINPIQPITSAVWIINETSWEKEDFSKMSKTEQIQIENSDIISFHCYASPEVFEQKIIELKTHNKPLICTEYLARSNNSTPITYLPIAVKHNVGVINWGFAEGKEGTKYPWESWEKSRSSLEPTQWHHLLFRKDYTPYITKEIEAIKNAREKFPNVF